MGKTQGEKMVAKEMERKDGAQMGSRDNATIVDNLATAPNGVRKAKEEAAK